MNPNYTLSTIQGIDALAPRNAVYWHKLATGWHVGYRKTPDGGSWHARHTDNNNANHRTQLSLGSDIDFDRACLLAR